MKKITRRNFLLATGASAVSLGLTACTGTSSTATSSASTNVSTSNEETTTDPVTLSVLHHMSETQKQEAFVLLTEAFTEANPHITFNIEILSTGSQYEDSLKMKVSTDDAPDLIFGRAKYYNDFISAGICHDLTEYNLLETVQESVKPSGIINDKVYSVPMDLGAMGVFYNIDTFNENGLDIPMTWDEFIETCDTLVSNGITPLSAGFLESWIFAIVHNPDFYSSVRPNMPTVLEDLMNGTITFDQVEGFEGVTERMRTMVDYHSDDAWSLDATKSYSNLAIGAAPMLIQGNWAAASIRGIAEDGNFGFFTLPYLNDPEKNLLSVNADDSFMIAEASNHKAEAVEFLRYLTTTEASELFTGYANQISIVKDVNTSDLDPMLADIVAILETGLAVNIEEEPRMSGEYDSIYKELMENYALDRSVTFDQLVNDLNSEFKKINDLA